MVVVDVMVDVVEAGCLGVSSSMGYWLSAFLACPTIPGGDSFKRVAGQVGVALVGGAVGLGCGCATFETRTVRHAPPPTAPTEPT